MMMDMYLADLPHTACKWIMTLEMVVAKLDPRQPAPKKSTMDTS